MGAAVAKADIARLFVDGLGPLNLIFRGDVEHAFDGFDCRTDYIAVAGENGLRVNFVRIEANEVAEVGVGCEPTPVACARAFLVFVTSQDLRDVDFVGDYLEMPPDFT